VSFPSGVWGGVPAEIDRIGCILAIKSDLWWQPFPWISSESTEQIRCSLSRAYYSVITLPWILLMQTVWTFLVYVWLLGGGLRTPPQIPLAYGPGLFTLCPEQLRMCITNWVHAFAAVLRVKWKHEAQVHLWFNVASHASPVSSSRMNSRVTQHESLYRDVDQQNTRLELSRYDHLECHLMYDVNASVRHQPLNMTQALLSIHSRTSRIKSLYFLSSFFLQLNYLMNHTYQPV